MQTASLDAVATLEAEAVLEGIAAAQCGLDLLQAQRGCASTRLDHRLLLDGVDSGHPSDRLIEGYRRGGLGGSIERALEFFA